MIRYTRNEHSTPPAPSAGIHWMILLFVLALVVVPVATAESSETGTWFEISGSRTVEAHPAKPAMLRMADLPLFEDDHPGLLLKVREDGPKASKSSRVEIFPLPDPIVPGEYPLVSANSSAEGKIGASVILPKDQEKVFLPMAIYDEGVSGTLTLLESPAGTLRGRFTLEARLDANAEEPAVTVSGAFDRVVIPKAK